MSKAQQKILVVCHDAGGAEIVSAYVNKHRNTHTFFCYTGGPARKIFEKKKIKSFSLDTGNVSVCAILKQHTPFSFLLTGSSWASEIESDFRLWAGREGIKTVVYLDNWVNYRERFGYPKPGWRNDLPHEIWAGDTYAFSLARKYFRIPVKLVKNEYFSEVVRTYRAKERKSRDRQGKAILFLDEPITKALNFFNDKSAPRFGERDVLRTLLETVDRGALGKTVIIRFHPAEERNKYDDIIKQYAVRIKIIKSSHKNIDDDLVLSDTVVGMSTMALAISFLCGKKSISIMPRPLPTCTIPFPILKLRSMRTFRQQLLKQNL